MEEIEESEEEVGENKGSGFAETPKVGQHKELQQLQEHWEQLRQELVGSALWQEGQGLKQVTSNLRFDEPDWLMNQENEEDERE